MAEHQLYKQIGYEDQGKGVFRSHELDSGFSKNLNMVYQAEPWVPSRFYLGC